MTNPPVSTAQLQSQHTSIKRFCADSSIVTNEALRYLQRLCKHFRHKVPVTLTEQTGLIEFAMGTCELTADDHVLNMHCETVDYFALSEIMQTMQSHFERFSKPETAAITWNMTVPK